MTARSDVRLLAPGFSSTATDLLQVARAYVKAGDCVWDIGSNVGIFSFCAAWKAGPQGKVFALEADPYYAELLHRTAPCPTLSGQYAPVVPLLAPAAADRCCSIMELAIAKRGHSTNHLQTVSAWTERNGGRQASHAGDRRLPVCTLAKPDFVKYTLKGPNFCLSRGPARCSPRPGRACIWR